MAKTVITVDLSKDGIRELRDRIERYINSLDKKCAELLERMGQAGLKVASDGFSGAYYDGVNDVRVFVDRVSDNQLRVVANGEAVAFIEFGSGVSHGGGHPRAGMFGFGPGTYPGKGNWDNPHGWVYKGSSGSGGVWVRDDVYRTFGNPPAMAMESAGSAMIFEMVSAAEEVFGRW